MLPLLLKLLDYWHKATSNNLHNYIVFSFLMMSIMSAMAALSMTIYSWWKNTPPPPKEIFTLIEMELYALGTYATVNATAHVTKTMAGKPGANSTPMAPPAGPDPKPPIE